MPIPSLLNRLARQWPRHVVRAALILAAFALLHAWSTQQQQQTPLSPTPAQAPSLHDLSSRDLSPRRDGLAVAIVWDTRAPADLADDALARWRADAESALQAASAVLADFAHQRSRWPLRLALFTPASTQSAIPLLPMDAPQPALVAAALTQARLTSQSSADAGLSTTLVAAQQAILATRLTDGLLILLTPRQSGIDPAAAQTAADIASQAGPPTTHVLILPREAGDGPLQDRLVTQLAQALAALDPSYRPGWPPAAGQSVPAER